MQAYQHQTGPGTGQPLLVEVDAITIDLYARNGIYKECTNVANEYKEMLRITNDSDKTAGDISTGIALYNGLKLENWKEASCIMTAKVQKYVNLASYGYFKGVPRSTINNANTPNANIIDVNGINYKMLPPPPAMTRLEFFNPDWVNSRNYISHNSHNSTNELFYNTPMRLFSIKEAACQALFNGYNAEVFSQILAHSGRPIVCPFDSNGLINDKTSSGTTYPKRFLPPSFVVGTRSEALGRFDPHQRPEALMSSIDDVLGKIYGKATENADLFVAEETRKQIERVLTLKTPIKLAMGDTAGVALDETPEFIKKYLHNRDDKVPGDITGDMQVGCGVNIKGRILSRRRIDSGTSKNGASENCGILHCGIGTDAAGVPNINFDSNGILTGQPKNNSINTAQSGIPNSVGMVYPQGNLRITGMLQCLNTAAISSDNEFEIAEMRALLQAAFPELLNGNGTGSDQPSSYNTGVDSMKNFYNQNTQVSKPMAIPFGWMGHYLMFGPAYPRTLTSGVYTNACHSIPNSTSKELYYFNKGDIITILPYAASLPSGAVAASASNGHFRSDLCTLTLGDRSTTNISSSIVASAMYNAPASINWSNLYSGAAGTEPVMNGVTAYNVRISELLIFGDEYASQTTNIPITVLSGEDVVMKFGSLYDPLKGLYDTTAGLVGGSSKGAVFTSATTIAPAGYNIRWNEYSLLESNALASIDPTLEKGRRISGGSLLVNLPITTGVTNITNYFKNTAFNVSDRFGFNGSGSGTPTPITNAILGGNSLGIDPYWYHPSDDSIVTSNVNLAFTIFGLRYGAGFGGGSYYTSTAGRNTEALGLFAQPEPLFNGAPLLADVKNRAATLSNATWSSNSNVAMYQEYVSAGGAALHQRADGKQDCFAQLAANSNTTYSGAPRMLKFISALNWGGVANYNDLLFPSGTTNFTSFTNVVAYNAIGGFYHCGAYAPAILRRAKEKWGIAQPGILPPQNIMSAKEDSEIRKKFTELSSTSPLLNGIMVQEIKHTQNTHAVDSTYVASVVFAAPITSANIVPLFVD